MSSLVLPVMPPVSPMLAKSVPEIPPGTNVSSSNGDSRHPLPGRVRGKLQPDERGELFSNPIQWLS
jgi:hypothetical protein